MDLYKCAKCTLRSMRGYQKSQNTIITAYTSRNIQDRYFSTTHSRRADDVSKSEQQGEPKREEYNMAKLFGSSMSRRPAGTAAGRPLMSRGRTQSRSRTKLDHALNSAEGTAESLRSLLSHFGQSAANQDLLAKLDVNKTLSTKKRLPPLNLDPAPFQLGPKLGRTVHVDASRGRDVGAAFRQLQNLCMTNRVLQDFRYQRFHERPGLKRKRLKNVRWKARFKDGFKEMLERVQTMRKMGW